MIINMRKQNFLFISLILSIGIGLFSCNFGDGQNVNTFQNVLAVAGWDSRMGGTTIGIEGGTLSAPSLLDVMDGECLYIHQMTIDYDNQPSQEYTTVTGIVKDIIDQTYFYDYGNIDPNDLGDYTLPMTNVGATTDIFYRGRIFIGAAFKDKNPSFRLIFDPEEEEINGVRNLYLQAMPSGSSDSSENSAIHAFNFEHWLRKPDLETSYTYPGTSQKFDVYGIKVNIKYLSSIDSETGKPVYSTIADPNNPSRPIEFFIATIRD